MRSVHPLTFTALALLVVSCAKPVSVVSQVSNTGGSPPNSAIYGVQTTAESKLRMGTRHYAASVLDEAFSVNLPQGAVGSAERAAYDLARNTLDTMIRNEIDRFGGPCERYQTGCSGSKSQAPTVPVAATARLAITIRACDKLLANDLIVKHAIAQALGTTVTNVTLPSDTQLGQAYDLFYPGQAAPPVVVSALKAVIHQSQTLGYGAIEAWRYVLLSMCHSPDWQIP